MRERHGRFLPLLLSTLIVLSLISTPALGASGNGARTVSYQVEFVPASHDVVGKVSIETDESVVLSLNHLRNSARHNVTVEPLTDAEQLDGFKYRIEPSGGTATFKYRISTPPQSTVVSDDPQTVIGKHYAVFADGTLFPMPREKGSADIRVSFDTPETWRVFTATQSLGSEWETDSFEELRRTTVAAGEIKFHQENTHFGISTHNVWFNVSNPHEGHLVDLEDYYDISPSENARQHNREMAFYAKRFSDRIGRSPPTRIITTPVHNMYWKGWWDTDHGHRPGHVAHHAFHYYSPHEIDLPGHLSEGSASYYGDELATQYRDDPRHLGDRYLRHIILDNTVDRLETGKVKPYIFGPQLIWYLDRVIQRKSDGEYEFADVLEYMLHAEKYEYASVEEGELPEIVREATGIDISAEYEFALNNPSKWTDQTFSDVRTAYYSDYLRELDFQRKESLAPDIIYYAYLEIQVERRPEAAPFEISAERPYYTVSSYLDEQPAMDDFIADLREQRPVTKAEFTATLNEYTDGQSEDFFTYYSTYSRAPNMTDLRAYLDGDYQTLVQKQLYVERSVERIRRAAPPDSEYGEQADEIATLLARSREQMDAHEIEASIDTIDTAVERTNSLRRRDGDDDGVPDLQEYIQNDDSSDTESDTSPAQALAVDGYPSEWDDVRSVGSGGDGLAESLQVTKQGDSIYAAISLRQPFYTVQDPEIQFVGRYGRGHNSTEVFNFQYGFGPVPPGITNAYSLRNYTAVGPSVIEVRIPEEFLRFKETPDEIDLQASHRHTRGVARIRGIRVYAERRDFVDAEGSDMGSDRSSSSSDSESTGDARGSGELTLIVTSGPVTLPEGGFVVLFRVGENSTRTMLGHSKYLEPGYHQDIDFYSKDEVSISEKVTESDSLVMKRYLDDGNKMFDSLEAETPIREYTSDEATTGDTSTSTTGTSQTTDITTSATATTTPDTTPSGTETGESTGPTPGLGFVSAIAVLLGLLLATRTQR